MRRSQSCAHDNQWSVVVMSDVVFQIKLNTVWDTLKEQKLFLYFNNYLSGCPKRYIGDQKYWSSSGLDEETSFQARSGRRLM